MRPSDPDGTENDDEINTNAVDIFLLQFW
jgi:hypothetical protein